MKPLPSRQLGFSLVELLVSVLIGMLALMFATRMVAGTSQARDAALGGSESMQNGVLAMYSIGNDAAQSGWGLNDPLLVGCDTVLADTGGYALSATTRSGASVTPLAAAVIESNGSAPDRITLYRGGSMSGTGTLRIVANYSAGTALSVDRVPYGFAVGDVIVVAPETAGSARCAIAQVSSVDPVSSQQTISFATASNLRFNSGALGATYVGNQARLFNLGPGASLAFHTWSVSNGFLQLRAADMSGAGSTPLTVANNIVSIKAQYGFDTRAAATFDPETGLRVQQWSSSMIDADGDGVVGGAGDFQRVAALRIAVVARGAAPERPAADGTCSATTAQPILFARGEIDGVAAAPVTVAVAVSGDPLSWRCYRYRVFENVVPLRNAAWRPTA